MNNTDRYIVISTARAQTLGLEESILMQVLTDSTILAYTPANWYELDLVAVNKMIPFWTNETLYKVFNNLVDMNLIITDTPTQPDRLRYNILENRRNSNTNNNDDSWKPSDDLYLELKNMGIDKTFVDSKIEEFITYWAGRSSPSNSWNTKFRSFILRHARPEA